MEFNLADMFEDLVDKVADREALVAQKGDEQTRLTYAELEQRANRLAHHLEGRGIGPGDHVGCHLRNGNEYLEAVLACFKIRAVPVNVNYRYVEDELRYLYDDADLKASVVEAPFLSASRRCARIWGCSSTSSWSASQLRGITTTSRPTRTRSPQQRRPATSVDAAPTT